ncbi:methylenetetrahydrofolate reductase [Spelaeicoccus albus]|uniref:Methylenetetrahydrofolate reductase n=1 Tax=Spelaeicoccus albus TaxID=1280376 RepID=A0A7Z0IIT0_9MICO|nr:methylenetetrahydrofolate reductase [Spelaeicoccus albus]NYI68706.1 methylenetetrahydrofolate reductase (NADPH) [Spelaeicoccus albus]
MTNADDAISVAELLEDYSLEMTGKDVPGLIEAHESIPPGTRVNVTFLGNEDMPMRVSAAAAVRSFRLTPVPHISARRLESEAELRKFLDSLVERAAVDSVLVVGGDPATPAGPYADSLAVIRSGVLAEYGITKVGIGGYPEGHPDIRDEALWQALTDKARAVADVGHEVSVITQFGFDTGRVIEWVAGVRARGIDATLRIGVPGPAGIRRLLSYAKRFGVASSAGIARKYGFSLTNLLGTAGPDHFVRDLAAELPPAEREKVRLHFYTFGGLARTADWIAEFGASEP